MRIAQVICTFPPYKGGMGNSAYHFARLLLRQGHEAMVFTPAYRRLSPAEAAESGVAVTRLRPLFKSGNAAVLPQLFWRLKGYEAVILHYPFYGSMLPVLIFKWLNPRTKLLLYYHMDGVAKGLKGLLFRLSAATLLPLLVRAADRVLCSTVDYARHSGLAKTEPLWRDKFRALPFGFDEQAFAVDRPAAAADHFRLLFVGGLDRAHYFKGLAVLLEALAELKGKVRPFKLTVVGQEGELRPYYEQLALTAGLAGAVEFAGKLSDEELIKAYHDCDALVLPSTTQGEAFGIVLVEAMAMGKPVVASNLPGVRSVFVDGEQGLLAEPAQPGDLARQLGRLIEDEPLLKRLGGGAKTLAWQEYTWKAVGERLKQLLLELDKT